MQEYFEGKFLMDEEKNKIVDDVADMYQSHPRLVPKRRDRICNDIQGYEDTRIRENKHCV